jgi:hypothetical protein
MSYKGVADLLKLFPKVAVAVLSLVSASIAAIPVSSPSNGSTVASPAHFVASATSSYGITAMRIYVDNQSAYSVNASKLDTNLSLSSGKHYVVVQSWDSKGYVQKAPLNITVSGTSSSTTTAPSTATTYSNIDQMSGWQNCDSCAGIGGSGPSAPHSITLNVSNPSMDGKSAQFWLGGSTPYADALWWRQLGGNSNAHNFVYDLYFYVKNSSAPQALEFDVNQSANGYKYIFGTECDIRNTHTWKVWDTANARWVSTGIGCSAPAAYTWNHLTLEVKRSGNTATFVAITLNGKKSYINRTYYAKPVSASEINVAFQMDLNYAATDFSVWLDKVKLSYW